MRKWLELRMREWELKQNSNKKNIAIIIMKYVLFGKGSNNNSTFLSITLRTKNTLFLFSFILPPPQLVLYMCVCTRRIYLLLTNQQTNEAAKNFLNLQTAKKKNKINRRYMYICGVFISKKYWRPRGAHTADIKRVFSDARTHSFGPPMDLISVCGPRLITLLFLLFIFFRFIFLFRPPKHIPMIFSFQILTSIRPTPIENITQLLTQCPK